MKKRFLFDSPVLSASLHPGGEYALVSPFMEVRKREGGSRERKGELGYLFMEFYQWKI